jgi:hypothetical protein
MEMTQYIEKPLKQDLRSGSDTYAQISGGGTAYSRKSFLRIRGLCCILVILHHLSDHIDALRLFKYAGYLPVGFFLFCSGYGLVVSQTKKDYLKHLILVRIPVILLAYLVANVVYLCVRLVTGTLQQGTLVDFLFGGGALVTYSWYIICVLYLYGCFWLSHTIFSKHRKLADLGVICSVVVWVAVMVISGAARIHRYNAVICFMGGYLAGRNSGFKNALVKMPTEITAFWVFLLSFRLAVSCSVHGSAIWIRLIWMELAVCSFVIIMLNAGSRYVVKVGKSVFDNLAQISLEFYMYQGLMMLLLRNPLIQVQNDLLFGTMVFIGSLLLGILMHRVTIWLKVQLESMALRWGKQNCSI